MCGISFVYPELWKDRLAVSQTSSEPMFINGEWTEGTSGKRISVYDPSTEEVIAEIPDASQADIDAPVAAARHAFDEGGWPQTTAQDRGRILFRIAAKLREELPLLAEMEVAQLRQADRRSGVRHRRCRNLL